MIGYHYTTWETYQQIQETGLQLSILEKRHEAACDLVLEFIEDGCVWVYPEHMQGCELIGAVLSVAIRHDSHRLVCLEVDYFESESATKLAMKVADFSVEDIHLNHNLHGAGPFGHFQKRYDLITEPVPPERIQLVGEWDLLDVI